MDNDETELPASIADALRAVPPAGSDTRDEHVRAALSAWDARVEQPARVIDFVSPRRLVRSTAAAVLLVVGGVVGWSVHSPQSTEVAADSSVRAATPSTQSAPLSSTTVPKGSSTAQNGGLPRCTNGEIQPIDSVYVGEYRNTTDGKTYLVFTFNGTLEFVDKDTCQSVNLVPGTTTP